MSKSRPPTSMSSATSDSASPYMRVRARRTLKKTRYTTGDTQGSVSRHDTSPCRAYIFNWYITRVHPRSDRKIKLYLQTTLQYVGVVVLHQEIIRNSSNRQMNHENIKNLKYQTKKQEQTPMFRRDKRQLRGAKTTVSCLISTHI